MDDKLPFSKKDLLDGLTAQTVHADEFAALGADSATVLGKALCRAGLELGLSREEIASVVGLSEELLGKPLSPTSSSGERALQLIRLARDLHVLSGGDVEDMRQYMRSDNRLTRGVPAEQIKSQEGLSLVVSTIGSLRLK